MRKRSPMLYLLDILEAVDNAVTFTDGMSFDEFLRNRLVMDAVVRNIEVIGEAATHLDAGFKKKHPTVPWDKMKSMRNTLIHEYFGVDYEIVWHTVRESLPPLRDEIKRIAEFEEKK